MSRDVIFGTSTYFIDASTHMIILCCRHTRGTRSKNVWKRSSHLCTNYARLKKTLQFKTKQIFRFDFIFRYLQKTRYKKHQKKADKSTNVISVAKKGKNNATATTAATTANNKSAATSNNVGGAVNFVIPKIEQPDEQSTVTAAVCKPSEPNNVSSTGI